MWVAQNRLSATHWTSCLLGSVRHRGWVRRRGGVLRTGRAPGLAGEGTVLRTPLCGTREEYGRETRTAEGYLGWGGGERS
eukprot:scaffold14379_cov121-Isochrysis_galbana.AAC.3